MFLCCLSLNLALVFIVMIIGRWSEFSSVVVFQVVCLDSVSWVVVISGDVFCWSLLLGILVGELSFKMMWLEFCIRSDMVSPL